MKQVVIMPGGFHPFHAGHASLYQSAVKAFPNAEVYVAATNDTKTRPFPFSIKEKLAKLAGVAPGHFVQVKSPFKSEEITSQYNPNEDVLIFVRSEKDKTEQPKPGGTKKDGTPAYFQPYTGKNLQPFSKHAYIAYLPTVEFGPGITSATEIRNAWPTLDDRRKTAMVMSLYPSTQKNPKLAANVVKMLDMGMGNELSEARSNPDRNRRSGSGKYDLINYAEDIRDKDNWAVSMTMEPKLGINPRAAVSEDTPKGIYFYPLKYFMQMADRDESLPWGDNFPYIQLFQYDRSGEMTEQTQVDPAKLKQALSQYCSDEIIQQAIDDPEYDGTPYWFIYDCLSRLGKSDETNVIRWNKILRELGFTSVYDPGNGWIAYNEPTQGVVLDPRIIKQHKMFDNRNPTLQSRRYDMESLADSIGWSSYFQRESQSQRIYNHPDEKKVRLDVAKSMLKPFLGKSSEEAKEMGYDQALKAAADKVIEILKQQDVSEDKETDPVTSAVLNFYKPVVNDIHKEKLPDYVDQARGLLQKTNDPNVRSKLVDIFKKGKENPYIQGGIVTTVGAVLAGGILTTAQKMGLSPAQTNLALQAILNTVIPTVVSRINGKNWSDTIKYTLASAGIGTGIAGASLIENDPWGDQGNFAGDRPVNIGGSFTRTKLGVGDMVKVNAGHYKGIGEIAEIKGDQARVWMDNYGRSFVFDMSDLVKYIPESKDYLEEK